METLRTEEINERELAKMLHKLIIRMMLKVFPRAKKGTWMVG